jgi:arylsulfatase A-like enzyme
VTRLSRRVPRKPVGLAVGVLAVAVGVFLPPSEPRPAPPPSIDAVLAAKPNVLLLVWDTTRSGHLGPYGYDRDTTPNLARFAEESIVFEEARSVSIFTFTSHLSMLTGKYPAATGARMISRMQLDPRLCESVATHFSDAGYRTGAFVGTWVLHATTGIRRGFEVYDDRVDPAVGSTYAWSLVHDVQAVLADKLGILKANGQPHWFQDFQRPASEVLSAALEWIGEDDPRPWFCMVNLYDVHWPYVPSAESRERWVRPYAGPMDGYLFRSNAYPPGHVPTAEDGRHVGELYDAEMWQLDAEVDRFLAALELERTNTAVVLTSDHGEAFGEGGRFEHDDILEPQVRVPLLVRLPGAVPHRGRRSLRASGIDIAPTLLGLAGLGVPADVHGIDLLAADPGADREVLVEDRDHEGLDDVRLALYSGTWKLVRLGVGESATLHLYDLAADPVAVVDVAQDHPERTQELARRLEELRAPWADLDLAIEPDGGGSSEDALDGLGYLGKEEAPGTERP